MHLLPQSSLSTAVLLGLFLLPGASHAGRPLNVDDANVGDAGTGYVEAWYARQPGSARVWNLAPTYTPLDGLDLTAIVSRDRNEDLTTTSLQGKLQLTRPQAGGCHQAVVLGLAHPRGQRGTTPYANGIMSCDAGPGAVHMNFGLSRAPGGPSLPAVGVAWEQAFGAVTGHVEWQAQRGAKPTLGMGLRTDLVKDVQLDGSVGRNGGETLYSVGMKFQF